MFKSKTILTCSCFYFFLLNYTFTQYPTYPGCGDLSDNDFDIIRVIDAGLDPTMPHPLRIIFHQDEAGNTNFYYIQRTGWIKYYDASAGTVSAVGKLDVVMNTETGLVGMTLDPDFDVNRWIYLFRTPSSPKVYRLARFTLKPDNTLDHESEKVLFDIPDIDGGGVHTGGGMEFDEAGNLWISVGEHAASHTAEKYHSTTDSFLSAEDEAPDTYSLYGSLLRIHPEPDGSYTIPEGNFGEHWSSVFEAEGRNVLADKYRDTSLVRPEIYAKGFRNPWSMTLDPPTGWLAIADCQGECYYGNWNGVKHECPLDAPFEEHHIIKEQGFYGWPYFQGSNIPFAHTEETEKDPLAPVNTSPFRKGVDTLPPALPATYNYNDANGGRNCAVGGTIYRYDRNQTSPDRLPPHFDGVYLVSDYRRNWIRALEIDSNGNLVKVIGEVFSTGNPVSVTLELRQAPDGDLYMVNYSNGNSGFDATTGIYKIAYTGDCQLAPLKSPGGKNKIGKFRTLNGAGFVSLEGDFLIEFFDIQGRNVFSFRGSQNEAVPLEQITQKGIFRVKVTSGGESFESMFYNLFF
jgi:cytochrome c